MSKSWSWGLKSRIKSICEEVINLDLPTEKQIAGAIKSSLDAHSGKLNISSAAKRIKGTIKQARKEQLERLRTIINKPCLFLGPRSAALIYPYTPQADTLQEKPTRTGNYSPGPTSKTKSLRPMEEERTNLLTSIRLRRKFWESRGERLWALSRRTTSILTSC